MKKVILAISLATLTSTGMLIEFSGTDCEAELKEARKEIEIQKSIVKREMRIAQMAQKEALLSERKYLDTLVVIQQKYDSLQQLVRKK